VLPVAIPGNPEFQGEHPLVRREGLEDRRIVRPDPWDADHRALGPLDGWARVDRLEGPDDPLQNGTIPAHRAAGAGDAVAGVPGAAVDLPGVFRVWNGAEGLAGLTRLL